MGDDDQLVPWEEAPLQSQVERLTAQFYGWERRGRGWQVWPYAVELEPPFQPFLGHFASPVAAYDDGRRPGFFESLVEKLRGGTRGGTYSGQRPEYASEFEYSLNEPDPYSAPSQLSELQISVSPEFKITKDRAEQFLLSLAYCRYPIALELVGTDRSLTLQFAAAKSDEPQLRQQFTSLFAGTSVREGKRFLEALWEADGERGAAIADFGLSNEFMRPLKVCERLDPDPLMPVAGALSHLKEGELGILQVLFKRARAPWAESVIRSVTDDEGGAFFADDPKILSLSREKVSHPLFACVIRAGARSPEYGRAWEIVRYIGGALAQFARPTSNELIPLTNDGYPDGVHAEDLLLRQARRTGMLLNSGELLSLMHPSLAPVSIPRLKRKETKTKRAPAIAQGHRLVLGANAHQGESVEISLNPETRVRHAYVIGASGTGKSTLLLNMIIQDLQNGEGVGVLDPHGDLIDQILGHVPEERFEDVVLFDPSDEGHPVGFNILSAHSELEKNLLGSDLVATFRRLSAHWGDQMDSVLANAIVAFLESDRGGTLLDLRRFLVEEDFRDAFLNTVHDPEIVYYWQREFRLLKGKPQGPILTRLDTFLRPKLIRYMVAQRENRLDFGGIMNRKKIFLAKLAQGMIGESNAYLLGALLVSKFHQLAMGRQEIGASERSPFYLYIDEFQNFVTPSMASILSGARKYRLGLILAHQELRQLWGKDAEVASAVISNPSTRICFRLGDFDAKKLAPGFSFFDAEDLQNLGVGEAICRVERAENDFNLKTLPLPKVSPQTARDRRERLVALSRERYGRSREEVKQALAREFEDAPRREPAQEPNLRPSPPPAPKIVRPIAEAPENLTAIVPSETPLPGRGGQQHKYLQQLVKRVAESKGYRATIEKSILGGAGSVDVSLEADGVKIACEISVTTTDKHELDNIGKCLAAGYDTVILLASEAKAVTRFKEAVSAELDAANRKRVLVLLPDEFVGYLEEKEAAAASKEETVRGYKVKVQYRPVGGAEKSARKQAISQVVLGALKRLRGGEK